MPIQSRYSNQEFESLMQDVFQTLEQHKASRELSLMVLGNVAANIMNHQTDDKSREQLVEQFCKALQKSTR